MRYIFVFITMLWAQAVAAQDWEDQRVFGDPDAVQMLRILSNTDTRFFAPIIDGFLATRNDVAVAYAVTGSAELDDVYRAAPADFDIVISSAMDLQFKLANDGFALPVGNVTYPDWAQWRQSLFAFSTEPAAIVVNRAAFKGMALPASRLKGQWVDHLRPIKTKGLPQDLRLNPKVNPGKLPKRQQEGKI